MKSIEEKPLPAQQIAQERDKRRERILDELRRRAPSCFLCRLILEDVEKNGKLTGYPFDFNGGATFPRSGKIDHLRIERLIGLD